jgi:hypothetical protein
MTSQTDQLYDELCENQWELVFKVDALIQAEWDSPTLKKQISEIVKHHWRINDEITSVEDKS